MAAVPLLRPQEVIKAFEKLGWEVARQRGSHIIMTKSGHIRHPLHSKPSICSPRHLAQSYSPGLSVEEFISALKD